MDFANHIFEQDVVLSAELFARSAGLPDPERALMIAVLDEATRCLLNYADDDGPKRVLYDEARDWFESNEHGRLYDFQNVCDVLGIEASWLRRRLFAVRDRRRADTEAEAARASTSEATPTAAADGDRSEAGQRSGDALHDARRLA